MNRFFGSTLTVASSAVVVAEGEEKSASETEPVEEETALRLTAAEEEAEGVVVEPQGISFQSCFASTVDTRE